MTRLHAATVVAALAAVAALTAGTAARAQSADPRDRALDLATIEAAHALCGFELSDAQEDAILKRRQQLVDDDAVSADDLTAIEDEIAAAMRRQVSEGLCKPDGAEARLYKRKLGDLDVR